MTKDEAFLRWCAEGARLFSTCGKAQYMAIVVGTTGRVLGTGYNGGPSGMRHCNDGGCPRMQRGTSSGASYDDCIAIHAEENALLYSDAFARKDGTLYVNGAPCYGCSKKLANSGLRRVVYLVEPTLRDGWDAGIELLMSAGIAVDALRLA